MIRAIAHRKPLFGEELRKDLSVLEGYQGTMHQSYDENGPGIITSDELRIRVLDEDGQVFNDYCASGGLINLIDDASGEYYALNWAIQRDRSYWDKFKGYTEIIAADPLLTLKDYDASDTSVWPFSSDPSGNLVTPTILPTGLYMQKLEDFLERALLLAGAAQVVFNWGDLYLPKSGWMTFPDYDPRRLLEDGDPIPISDLWVVRGWSDAWATANEVDWDQPWAGRTAWDVVSEILKVFAAVVRMEPGSGVNKAVVVSRTRMPLYAAEPLDTRQIVLVDGGPRHYKSGGLPAYRGFRVECSKATPHLGYDSGESDSGDGIDETPESIAQAFEPQTAGETNGPASTILDFDLPAIQWLALYWGASQPTHTFDWWHFPRNELAEMCANAWREHLGSTSFLSGIPSTQTGFERIDITVLGAKPSSLFRRAIVDGSLTGDLYTMVYRARVDLRTGKTELSITGTSLHNSNPWVPTARNESPELLRIEQAGPANVTRVSSDPVRLPNGELVYHWADPRDWSSATFPVSTTDATGEAAQITASASRRVKQFHVFYFHSQDGNAPDGGLHPLATSTNGFWYRAGSTTDTRLAFRIPAGWIVYVWVGLECSGMSTDTGSLETYNEAS